jgi:hypothetical protein
MIDKNGSLGISSRADDELSRDLFAKLLRRFEAARKKDPSIQVIEVWSVGFRLNRPGNLLIVNQAKDGRLIEITLLWTRNPRERKPWRAAICRSLDRTRVALIPGPEGTVDEIVEAVVRTVLSKTELQ